MSVVTKIAYVGTGVTDIAECYSVMLQVPLNVTQ